MSTLAGTPDPPYYAVVFTSRRSAHDPQGYAATADRMVELATLQPGFLGVESARGEDGVGITVSYWSSLESIRNWRDVAGHRAAQAGGRSKWYDEFRLRVCRVERESSFVRQSQAANDLGRT
ncbi:MAG: antibiotic biosynthesis monooxygenase [Planctomycetia bacterium]|nr:antibiotic biosynthesis monooxygenase [Planctomycetia bacterium]